MESMNQDGAPRPSYVFSADPIERPSEINFDGIKLDLSHEFSLVASNAEINSLESKDYLQVCLRIRPLTQSEKDHESEGCVCILDSQTILLKDPQNVVGQSSEKNSGQMAQKFSFSKVFGPDTTQKEFFQGCIMQLVKDLLKGQSRLIFTYGVTNSGKTYTIQGTEENTGILPRTLNVLFDSLRERLYTKMNLKPHRSREYLRLSSDQEKEEVANKSTLLRQIKEVAVHNDSYDTIYGSLVNSLNTSEFEESMDCEQTSLNRNNNIKFSVWVSFFEIYNECIYDLFVPVSSKFQKRKMLRLSQDVKGYSFIKDLQWIQVSDSKEAYRLLKVGIKNQSVAFTKLNNASSRSHSIFTIRILQIEDSDMPRVIRVSELSLCDLAGSERSVKTHNEGERLRETGNINSSLLTLGKCINVLKNSEKSKFQQHVPFRESKLTHYFQSFFNGKGKICMIVNISQCCLAYDETLNVLKFSAIAQKVFVPDTLNTSLEKSFVPAKSCQDISLDINDSGNNVKRTTISWESNLEDLVEDEDLAEDVEKNEENQNERTEFTEEDLDETLEEDKTAISQEKRKLLDLIEDLKTKLINEKKEKLTLEFKIREEVTQEFTQYLAQREADFKETLLQEREIMEENAECRLAIFKDLVGKCDVQEGPMNEDCALKVGTEETHNCVEIEDIIDSLQDDVTDIKKQAEIAHLYIASLADPQEAIACLELKFNQVKAELAKTKEELIRTQENLKKRENESEINLNSLAQELETPNKDKTETSSLIINNKLTCSEIGEVLKDSEIKTSSGRKRSNESELLPQDEPPAKKGLIHISPSISEDHRKSEDMQQSIFKEEDIRVLQENNAELKTRLLVVKNELINEKEEKAELNKQIVSLQQELSSEKNFTLSIEVQQMQSKYENAVSELHVQRGINQEQEEKIMKLSKEIEIARKNISNNVSQIKLMQTKIDELRMLDLGSQISNIDLLSLRDLSNGSHDLLNTDLDLLSNDCLVSKQVKESSIQELSRESSFHCSIEAIWEECKEIVKVSSQKSHQIQELAQKVEKLQAEVKSYRDEDDRLKTERENKNQEDLLKEKESLIQQLEEKLQEQTVCLNVEVQHVLEGKRALSELTQDVTCYKAKIQELETILETQKDKNSCSAKLEQEILEKESAILKLERNLEEFQANLQDSLKTTKNLSEQEVQLKEEITQLTNYMQDVKHSLQLKEEENENCRQEIEKLKEELSISSALNKTLKVDLQRREEDYTELKEKLTDAKKQIEQVQKEVCVMRDEEKLLRIKINELEKKKNQCSQEIDMKQRTIQQLKEQLNNQKTEEAIQQYEKICKDLNIKEKIIAEMRMTLEEQEKTQVEQDQVLEAKLEEMERLATELEEWKDKFKDLETKSIQSSNKEFEDNIDVLSKNLSKLQDELQESEQKYQADRKKWLEEKNMLITQAKEAENLRNKEMKKYAEDRERCLKQHNEVEKLTALLAEKDNDLQKWREERDQLVAALEIQLRTLISSNIQKDNEIEQLKKVTAEASKMEKPSVEIMPRHTSSVDPGGVETETQSTSFEIFTNEVEGGSVVLDSCEVSTENVQITRFPKPELEIQFTPLQPNRVAVKHPGCASPVTVKISKPRKRKSNDTEESNIFSSWWKSRNSINHTPEAIHQDLVKCENKKNTTPRTNLKFPISEHRNSSVKKEQKVSIRPSSKKTYSLRSQASTISVHLTTKKKEGTLQKFGDFLQQSPTILQSKAKKLIETISTSKPVNMDTSKENASRPKRAKRKLYTNEISSPIDISGHVILMDQRVKESDHQILKRRLRTKMAK